MLWVNVAPVLVDDFTGTMRLGSVMELVSASGVAGEGVYGGRG